MNRIVFGRWPVWEALQADPTRFMKIWVADGLQGELITSLKRLAKVNNILVTVCDQKQLRQMTTGNHQGIIAELSPHSYKDFDTWLKEATQPAARPPLALVLDEIQDPQNLGAILRSASLFGATGVIIPSRRACGLTPVVVKTSAGASEHIPVIRVGNLHQAILQLKDSQFWIAGGDAQGQPPWTQDWNRRVALVIGSEGKGLRRLTRDTCDFLVHVPTVGPVGSLNASCAASVLLYEIFRQRTAPPAP